MTMAAMTLEEAREILEANLDKGISCPCCTQYARRYRRKLNAGLARFLIYLYRQFQKQPQLEWFNIRQAKEGADFGVSISGEFCKLQCWGLIEPRPKDSGYWRLTDLGRAFVEKRTTVKSHIVVFNNTLEGFHGCDILITDALASKFDYDELMAE